MIICEKSGVRMHVIHSSYQYHVLIAMRMLIGSQINP